MHSRFMRTLVCHPRSPQVKGPDAGRMRTHELLEWPVDDEEVVDEPLGASAVDFAERTKGLASIRLQVVEKMLSKHVVV